MILMVICIGCQEIHRLVPVSDEFDSLSNLNVLNNVIDLAFRNICNHLLLFMSLFFSFFVAWGRRVWRKKCLRIFML